MRYLRRFAILPPGVIQMCTADDQLPGSAADALRMMDAALGFFDGPGGDALDASALGPVLEALGGLSARFAAVRAAVLCRFDGAAAHDQDGYGSTASWLAAKGRTTRAAANAEVRKMRVMHEHPEIHQALARKEISESWATEIAKWTARFPTEIRGDVDRLLLDTAAAGASLDDLSVVAQAAFAIPGRDKIRGRQGKLALKQAAQAWLPKEIIYRPKASFSAPLRAWVRNDLQEVINDTLVNGELTGAGMLRPAALNRLIEAERAGREDNAKQIWQLLSMELWYRNARSMGVAA